MSYIICNCGAQCSDVASPNRHYGRVIDDVALDAIVEDGVGDDVTDGDFIPYDAFTTRSKWVITCWSCGRLMVEGEGGVFKTFVEEK